MVFIACRCLGFSESSYRTIAQFFNIGTLAVVNESAQYWQLHYLYAFCGCMDAIWLDEGVFRVCGQNKEVTRCLRCSNITGWSHIIWIDLFEHIGMSKQVSHYKVLKTSGVSLVVNGMQKVETFPCMGTLLWTFKCWSFCHSVYTNVKWSPATSLVWV